MIERMRRILQVMDRHHLWDQGIELIGSWCFYFYQRHCGVAPYPLRTQDIDFLLPYPYRGRRAETLLQDLQALGFEQDFRADGSVYLRSEDFQIDFIVPARGAGMDKAANIPALGLRAVPLRFVGMLLSHPMSVTEGDLTISIPSPSAFCLHKLLIAPRRPRIAKRLKDWEQALRVSAVLTERQLRSVYEGFPAAWKKRIRESLGAAAQHLPLLEDETRRLSVTLQHVEHGRA